RHGPLPDRARPGRARRPDRRGRSRRPREPSAPLRASNLTSTMNGPNTPLPAGTLDELLSADIDGELERAAADHGLALADARAAIATPEAAARRRVLAEARDLVAAPVPLDPAD